MVFGLIPPGTHTTKIFVSLSRNFIWSKVWFVSMVVFMGGRANQNSFLNYKIMKM